MRVEDEEISQEYYKSVMTWLDAPPILLIRKRSSVPLLPLMVEVQKLIFLVFRLVPLNMLVLLGSSGGLRRR